MEQTKIEVGDIRPIYNVSGFQVCKKTSDKPDEIEWTPVEKISEAEILSFVYQQKPTTEVGDAEEENDEEEPVEDEIEDEEPEEVKVKKKAGRPKKKHQNIDDEIAELQQKIKELEAPNETEITDDDL